MTPDLHQRAGLINLLFCMTSGLVGCSYVSVGDDLKMFCELKQHHLRSLSAHNISFSVRHPHQNSGEARCLGKSHVDVLNRTTAMLTLPNVSLPDTGQYTCHVGSSHCQTSETEAKMDLIVLSESFVVEEAPQNVINLECVVINWDESMKCKWQHPVNYANQEAISVTCLFTVEHSRLAYTCPQQSYNSCRWSRGQFMATSEYVLEVSITNTRTTRRASAIFVIHTLNIVKPAPVEQLTAIEDPKGTGCFNVSWTHPRKNRPKVYRLQQQIVGNTHMSIVADDINDTHVTSCGHEPHTHHRFAVTCWPTSIWSGSWSDLVFTEAWTSMTAPGLGPRTTNGSFTSTECLDGVRNVTVMWQEVERHQQNGVIEGYSIQQGETTVTNVSAQNFSAEVELSCTSTSEIRIYAHNEAGYSLQPSVIIIPPVTFKVPQTIQDSFAVKITWNQTANQKESLVAIWDANTTSENITCTIFWCMSQSWITCQGEINWAVVPGHQTQLAIALPANLSTKYLYGISVTNLQRGLTSGIDWTQCLFLDQPSQSSSVNNLRVQAWEGGVWLSWDLQQCTYQSKVKVTGYIVKWCPQSHREEKHEAWVPATKCLYTVRHLEENVAYLFTVQSVRHGVKADEVTPWISATVPGPGTPVWWLTVFGLVVAIPVLLCVFCGCRAFKNRGNKFKAMADTQISDLLKGLPTSPTQDVAINNLLLQRPSQDSLSPTVSRSVNSTSNESLTPSPGVTSAHTHGGDSESDDSFHAGNCNNSRTALITTPARGSRKQKVVEPSTDPAGVCVLALKMNNMPQFG